MIALVFASLLVVAAGQKVGPLQTANITFRSAGVSLAGTVVLPAESGRRPAVVLLGGSGPAPREPLMVYARHFASLGLVALAFDKRGSGESQGDWTDASLDDLAGDATAAMAFLAARPDVDPARIGVWGVSQAGWVVPLLAGRAQRPAFSIVVTGGGATPREIEMFGYRSALEAGQVPASDRARAEALLVKYFSWLGSGAGREALLAEVGRVKDEPWFKFIRIDRTIPSDASRPKWAWVATFDPAASIAQMRTPTLVVLGAGDPLGPADLSAARWKQALEGGGNPDASVQLFEDMGHAARQGQSHNASNLISPSYLKAIESFVKRYLLG